MMKDVVTCNKCGQIGEKKDYILVQAGSFGLYACPGCFKAYIGCGFFADHEILENKSSVCMWCKNIADMEKCNNCSAKRYRADFFPAEKDDIACCNCEKFKECYEGRETIDTIKSCFVRKKGAPHKNPAIL